MTRDTSDRSGTQPSDVRTLLEQRATVQGWIARLDSQRGSVSDHIVARVRADYDSRLQATLEALANHRESVEAELEQATRTMSDAESEHASAIDRLEEGRLRNLIGELDHEGWAEERSALEEAVRAAAERESGAREETDRLQELLGQLDEQESIPASDADATVESGPAAFREDEEEGTPPPTPSPAPFLADIDRALSNPPAESAVDIPFVEDLPFEETAPKPGLKCGECGYTNDLSAWYCGVCGADVG